jgi:hypothetical protein
MQVYRGRGASPTLGGAKLPGHLARSRKQSREGQAEARAAHEVVTQAGFPGRMD